MKLFYSPASPYARKVRIVIIERGLEKHVDIISAHPLVAGEAEHIPNPLGKVPALQLDDGRVLIDSPLICAYLDEIGEAPPLIPLQGENRWNVALAQALGDGILDAAVNTVMEMRRAESERSPYWLARWEAAILRSLPEVAEDLSTADASFDLGKITYACVLGYLDFRLPHIDWRSKHPALAGWWEALATRPSLVATRPS